MRITGPDIRPGADFRLTQKPHCCAASTFTAVLPDRVLVTRRLTDVLALTDDVEVLAHWHGERRTDAFATTVGALRTLAAQYA